MGKPSPALHPPARRRKEKLDWAEKVAGLVPRGGSCACSWARSRRLHGTGFACSTMPGPRPGRRACHPARRRCDRGRGARPIAAPRSRMRLKWEPGTVTVFDNFATQHRAIGDRYPQPRVMHRVTIAGDRRLDASPLAASA